MQVTLPISDIELEALAESAAKAGLSLSDLLDRAVGLVLEEQRLASREPPAKIAATWSVDPTTKAVTRVGPPDGTHVTATEVRAFSHPLAKPGDWDRAMARAMRNPPAPT